MNDDKPIVSQAQEDLMMKVALILLCLWAVLQIGGAIYGLTNCVILKRGDHGKAKPESTGHNSTVPAY